MTVVNESSHELPADWLTDVDYALHRGLKDIAAAWGEYVWHITAALRSQNVRIKLVDTTPEAPGALAYHDLDADGPFIRVALNDILENGGDWYDGDLSIPSVIDHETKETVIDPLANAWHNDGNGVLWARESCDPVQDETYTVTTPTGKVFTLSNFVYPAYFDPFADGDKLDFNGSLTKPFTMTSGGYMIRQSAGRITQVFGAGVPAWRSARAHRALERSAYGDLVVTQESP